jgi:hypothetical protein
MKLIFYSILGSIYVITAFWLGTMPASAQIGFLPALYNGPTALCRLGVNGTLSSYAVKPLRLGAFIDYTASAPAIAGVTYLPVIRLEETSTGYNYSIQHGRVPATESELRQAVAKMPGHYWIIGNEPDRIIFQDDIWPHLYATAYHDLYNIIKDQDPTAKIVAGAIVQPTPLRLQYLDLVLESYFQQYRRAMPVDAWAFHNFILNEASCDAFPASQCWGAGIPKGIDAVSGLRIEVQENDRIDLFQQQVTAFRQWMAKRGYRNTPAFLTEFGVLMPEGRFQPDFDEVRVNNFMDASFDFLLNATDPDIGYPGDNNRLVQRFAWYSIDDNVNHNGALFAQNAQNARTPMGDNFAAYAKALEEQVDLYLEDLSLVGVPPLTNQGTATVTLQAVVGNSGNLSAKSFAIVRFFRGNPASGGKRIGASQIVNVQGCGEKSTVRVEWSNVAPGNYTIYVQIQSFGTELDLANNQGTFPVDFRGQHLFLPNMKRDLDLLE